MDAWRREVERCRGGGVGDGWRREGGFGDVGLRVYERGDPRARRDERIEQWRRGTEDWRDRIDLWRRGI